MEWIKNIFRNWRNRPRKRVDNQEDKLLIDQFKEVREEIKQTYGLSSFYENHDAIRALYANSNSFVSSTLFVIKNFRGHLNEPTKRRLRIIIYLYKKNVL